jgi:exodeoxyribonuclease VII large subunit
MYMKILTVTSLNNYIKKVLDNDYILRNIYVRGEISNLKIHESGHIYFSLKDEGGKVNAVMFKSQSFQLNFMPVNGMSVEIKGRVSVYPKDGSYQLYCDEMKQVGVGELFAAYLKMKSKLEQNGLFDSQHKKLIPILPRRIGIITSPSGAAVQDILNVINRRNSSINVLIYPSLVQGSGASDNIIQGIKYLNTLEDIDVIILARGGGSIEELWAFNNEELAYAVYNSKKPIITGVGHETDFTIVDFVSDRRAPTPSAAAEIAVPSINDINERVNNIRYNLTRLMKNGIMNKYNSVELLKRSLQINNPLNYLTNAYSFIDNLKNRLNSSVAYKLNNEKVLLSKHLSIINAHNPLNVLKKGYSVLQDDNQSIISSIACLKQLKEVNIKLKDGSLKTKLDIMEVKNAEEI